MKAKSWFWLIGGLIVSFILLSVFIGWVVVRSFQLPLQLVDELSNPGISFVELTEENQYKTQLFGGGVFVVDEIGTRLKSGQVEIWKRDGGVKNYDRESVPADFEFAIGYAIGRIVGATAVDPKLTANCGFVSLDESGHFRLLADTMDGSLNSFYYSDGDYVADGVWKVGRSTGEGNWQRYDQFELRLIDLKKEGLTAFDQYGTKIFELPTAQAGLVVGLPDLFVGDADIVVEFVTHGGTTHRSEPLSIYRGKEFLYQFFPLDGDHEKVREVVRLSRFQNVISVPRMVFSSR